MIIFEAIIFLLLGGVTLAAISRKWGAPYPALLAMAGTALAFVPGMPVIVLDPELALALFIAPVLLDAAFDSSPRDLKANWKPITSLAIGAVALTIIAVAFISKLLIPQLPWAAAITLGAIVAPPDAVAASAVLKHLNLPRRLLVILEGESLFNDASALLVYRMAVALTLGGLLTSWDVFKTFLIVSIGSVVLGLMLAKIILSITKKIKDVSSAIVIQFCSTFAVWIIAERLHLSGIITIVVVGITTARNIPAIMSARMRIPTFAFWDVAVFVLNILAFFLVGLQLQTLNNRTSPEEGEFYFVSAAIICLTVIIARLIWIFLATAIDKFLKRNLNEEQKIIWELEGISIKGGLIIGWCGMRGTITLAAALALPLDFPNRDFLFASAFGVTLGTLILQGLTLRPLLLKLGLKDSGSVAREVQIARVSSLKEAINAIEKFPKNSTSELVQKSYALQLTQAEQNLNSESDKIPDNLISNEIFRVANQAQRQSLVSLRSQNKIGDAAFQNIEEELDWMELGWAQVLKYDEDS